MDGRGYRRESEVYKTDANYGRVQIADWSYTAGAYQYDAAVAKVYLRDSEDNAEDFGYFTTVQGALDFAMKISHENPGKLAEVALVDAMISVGGPTNFGDAGRMGDKVDYWSYVAVGSFGYNFNISIISGGEHSGLTTRYAYDYAYRSGDIYSDTFANASADSLIVIYGDGSLTIDGATTAEDGSTVNGMKLMGGRSRSWTDSTLYGAILHHGTESINLTQLHDFDLTVRNVDVVGGMGSQGGAFYLRSVQNVLIENTTFENGDDDTYMVPIGYMFRPARTGA